MPKADVRSNITEPEYVWNAVIKKEENLLIRLLTQCVPIRIKRVQLNHGKAAEGETFKII